MGRKIKISIDPKSKIKVEFDGYSGDACYTAAKELEDAVASFGISSEGKTTEAKEDFITDDPMQLNKQFN